MKLKLDKDGNVVTKEVGENLLPVYVRNGKDETHDAASAIETIKTQANEIEEMEKSSDVETKALTKKVRAWEKIGDIADVRKAVKTAAALSDKDLDPEGAAQQIATLKAETETLTAELNDAKDAGAEKDGLIYNLAVGNSIKGSKFVRENLIDAFADNPENVEKLYGGNFKFENGEVRAYDAKGTPILHVDPETNKTRPATVDEALNSLMGPEFRKPSGAKGSDAPADGPPSQHDAAVRNKGDLKTPEAKAKYMDDHGRAAFEALPPAKRDDVASV